MRSGLTYMFAIMVLCFLWGTQNLMAVVPQHKDSIINPALVKNDVLEFDAAVINVGEISEDDAPQTYTFVFKNTGSEPVVVTKVTSSCGCALASFSREPVKAGQRAEISVRYSPRGYPGALSRNVFVYTNTSGARPLAKLTLRGFVHPTKDQWRGYRVIMGSSLRAKTNRMVFKAMPKNGIRVENIECVNTGSAPLKLEASMGSLPEYVTFHTEPEVIAPGQIADMVVAIDGSKLPEGYAETAEWTVLLEGLEGQPSQRTLHIEANFVK